MSSFPELVNKVDTNRERAARLSAPITKDQADTAQLASSIGGAGFENRARRFSEASDRLEEAESLRQALEGSLVKAHWQLMSAIHGKLGPGSRENAGFYKRYPDGSTVWRGRRGGARVEITSVPTELEHDPTGVELLEDREERRGKLSSFRTATRDAMRAASDIKDAGKTAAQTHWDAAGLSDAKPVQLIPETGQPPSPETFREVPGQGLHAGDVIGNSLVWAVGAAAVFAKLTRHWGNEDDS